jgi:hypothetical protein
MIDGRLMMATFTGSLLRRQSDPESKYFDGTMQATFSTTPGKKYPIKTIGVFDGTTNLELRFSGWPVFKGANVVGTRISADRFTKQD